jgi:predicted RNA binding protein YcfA (HicA-like mRNA interferase family)
MTGRLPAVTPRKVMRALERAGFVCIRVSGSHHIYEHPARPDEIVPVPRHDRDLKRGTLQSILRLAGLTRDEFLKLL